MKNQSRDFLIRNMPIEIYSLLEESAKEHLRSKNQEAIVVLSNGLKKQPYHIQQPVPFKWKKKVSSKFIKDAIEEGRD